MKLLLDTHILVWYISGDCKLTKYTKDLIEDQNNTVYFSAINVWEIVLKKSLKDDVVDNGLSNFTADLIEAGLEPLPFTLRNIYQLENIKLKNNKIIHKDPFDNALMAQAKTSKMYLISHDSCFENYDEEYLIRV